MKENNKNIIKEIDAKIKKNPKYIHAIKNFKKI